MSNYVKSTDFASKDALASGNAAKIVKGTEIDTEFNNIATAVATKADLASPSFTGTVTANTVNAGATSVTSITASSGNISSLTATIVAGSITGITDLAVADGGTGASTAANARVNLGTVADTASNGIAVRTAANTLAARTITAGTGITITDGDGVAGNPTITNSSPSIGVSQTWQDVKSSRAIGSVYTNSTGRPIMVIITGQNSGTSGSSRLSFTVAGVTVGATTLAESNGTAWNSFLNPITFIVPDGDNYSVSQAVGTSTISTWVELR